MKTAAWTDTSGPRVIASAKIQTHQTEVTGFPRK